MVSTHYLDICLLQSFHNSHANLCLWKHDPIDLEFIRSKVKIERITCVKNGVPSISWELLITELSYVKCLLVLVRAWPLLILLSLCQGSRSQGSVCKKRFLLIFRTIYLRAFIRFVLIGLRRDPYWFWVHLIKCHGLKCLFCKKCKHGFCSLSWKLLSQSFNISYADWSWWEYNPWLLFSSLGQRSRLHSSLLWLAI